VGAGVVYVDPGLSGAEIEIRRPPAAWDGRHTQARRRLVPGGAAMWAAVFESLAEGFYELRLRPPIPEGVVVALEIRGGAVTEIDWPGSTDAVAFPNTTDRV
jgi:hypothetical protein